MKKPNYKQRRGRLKKKIGSTGADAMLVTNINNVRYLTGFTGSTAYLLVSKSKEILMSDTRYEEQLESECSDLTVDIRDTNSTILDSVERIASACKFSIVAYESTSLTKSAFDELDKNLESIELVSSSGLVEELRAIKDTFEIAAIRKSIDVNQRAFRVIAAQLTGDQTELNIAHNLEHQMRSFGAKCCAFDAIVGVGPRSALPHGQPGKTKLNESSFVLIDWGAQVNGYLSDLTRMIIYGKISTRLRKIYETVSKAQLAAIKKIRPGVSFKAVDSAARKVIENAGFGDKFGHGLGHSFGLEIHEKPYLSPIEKGKLQAGMVLTVEPGIYLPNFGGVRIEDDVLVTSDGHEVLSNLPRQIDECTVDLGA